MSEFWYTVYTMQEKYGEDYQSFTLFGPLHLFWLILALCICVICSIINRRLSEKGKSRFLRIIMALLLAEEITRQTVTLVTGQWQPEMMPLHMCSINIFVCLWYVIHPNKLAGNILYALCLPGAVIALFSPTWLALPITNLFHILSEALHILLTLFPVLLLGGGFRPEPRMLPKVFLCLLGACTVIYPLNKALGTNFFFLNDPDGNIITKVCSSIFGERFYIVGMVIILAVMWVVLYLPWWLKGRKQKSTSDNAL